MIYLWKSWTAVANIALKIDKASDILALEDNVYQFVNLKPRRRRYSSNIYHEIWNGTNAKCCTDMFRNGIN